LSSVKLFNPKNKKINYNPRYLIFKRQIFKQQIIKLDMVRKGNIPWNKGKKGLQIAWNKDKKVPEISGKNHPMFGKKHTPESLLKMSESHKKSWSNFEVRKKIIESQKKAWLNPEFKKRISESRKGRIASEETRKKMSETNRRLKIWTGRHHSEESKRKMSLYHKSPPSKFSFKKGNIISEETRKKISESHKGKPTWNNGTRGLQVSWMKGKHHTEESNIKNRLAHLGKTSWNKGKHTGLIPWNKGKIGILHHSEEAKLKIKNSRAKQIFPLKDSLPEIKIQNFLKQLNIEFIPHKYLTKIKHKYQCDVFVPNLNLIIECDGDYWHGNLNNSRFKILNEKQIKTKEKDNLRTKELKEIGFNVLRLWESEIEKMSLEDFIKIINPFEKGLKNLKDI